MRVTMVLEFPASYCRLAMGISQVYLLYFSHKLKHSIYNFFTLTLHLVIQIIKYANGITLE